MTPQELNVLATHEAGHAVVSLNCPHAPPIERITIASEMQWAFGYVRHADPHHKYIQTVNFYLDMICVALGAREAEKVFLSDISLGATGDLQSATMIARELVEVHGYGAADVVQYRRMDHQGSRHPDLSPKVLEELDERVRAIVEEQRMRAEKIIAENKAMVETLRDLLLEHKTIDAKVLTELAPEKAAKKAKKKESDVGWVEALRGPPRRPPVGLAKPRPHPTKQNRRRSIWRRHGRTDDPPPERPGDRQARHHHRHEVGRGRPAPRARADAPGAVEKVIGKDNVGKVIIEREDEKAPAAAEGASRNRGARHRNKEG